MPAAPARVASGTRPGISSILSRSAVNQRDTRGCAALASRFTSTNRSRFPMTFAKVMGNLERFVEVKREAAAVHPRVSLWFTALRDNIEEIPGLVLLATRAGAAGIYLQRLVYNGLGLATKEQSLYGRLQEREAALIRETEHAARAAGLSFSASGAAAPEISLTPSHDDRPWSQCRRPWSLVYVTVHGHVLPCCIAPWITEHYDGIILGNLYQQSLEDIWWGQHYLDFRTAIQTDVPPEPCRGCGVKWSL